jgi:hypothetical protein
MLVKLVISNFKMVCQTPLTSVTQLQKNKGEIDGAHSRAATTEETERATIYRFKTISSGS